MLSFNTSLIPAQKFSIGFLALQEDQGAESAAMQLVEIRCLAQGHTCLAQVDLMLIKQ